MRQLGLEAAALPEALDRVQRALAGTLADPRGRWILDPSHREARSEMPLSGWLDRRLVEVVLDRTFVDGEGVRWIIDFKTGDHAGGGLDAFLDREQARYAGQLLRYGRLMSSLDGRPIRLGLYFPMVAGWRSWSPGTGP